MRYPAGLRIFLFHTFVFLRFGLRRKSSINNGVPYSGRTSLAQLPGFTTHTFVSMASYLQKLLMPFQVALRKSVESFIRLETADDEYTLVAEDGSLISVVKVDGSRQVIGDEEYKFLVDAATIKIGARFDRAASNLEPAVELGALHHRSARGVDQAGP